MHDRHFTPLVWNKQPILNLFSFLAVTEGQ
jgi:hypothetical protein